MFKNIKDSPITSWIGLVVLIVGAALLGFEKITWDQFLLFLALAGVGGFMKDIKKGV